MKRAMSLVLAGLLGGCAVTPYVSYKDLSERPRRDNWVTYQLTDTTIVLGVFARPPTPPQQPNPLGVVPAGETAKGGAPAAAGAPSAKPPAAGGGNAIIQPVYRSELMPITLDGAHLTCTVDGCSDKAVAAAAVGFPYEGVTLAIEPERHNFMRTSIAPAYFPRSLRLKLLTIEVKDQRKELIDTVGAAAVGVARITQPAVGARSGLPGEAEPPKTLNLPVTFDLATAKRTLTEGPQPLPLNPGWTYSIHFIDDPEGAGFLKLAERGSVHGAILTSLCRPMQITLKNGDVALQLGVTVADPDYLTATPLPPKGSVVFDDLCGVDIQAQPYTEVPTNELVSDFFNQVQALRVETAPVPVKKGGTAPPTTVVNVNVQSTQPVQPPPKPK